MSSQSAEPGPFSSLPIAAIKYHNTPCDKCGGRMHNMNSVGAFEFYFNRLAALANSDRHLLRVIENGKILCEGSPSRAQSLPFQPRDTRPEYANIMSRHNVSEMRSAYWGARHWHANLQAPRIETHVQELTSCPICHAPSHLFNFGSVKDGWVLQFHCSRCDPEDALRPIMVVPFEIKGAPHLTVAGKLLGNEDISLLGLAAIRTPLAALRAGWSQLPEDLPEYTPAEKEALSRKNRLWD